MQRTVARLFTLSTESRTPQGIDDLYSLRHERFTDNTSGIMFVLRFPTWVATKSYRMTRSYSVPFTFGNVRILTPQRHYGAGEVCEAPLRTCYKLSKLRIEGFSLECPSDEHTPGQHIPHRYSDGWPTNSKCVRRIHCSPMLQPDSSSGLLAHCNRFLINRQLLYNHLPVCCLKESDDWSKLKVNLNQVHSEQGACQHSIY